MGRLAAGDQILSPRSYRPDDKALCSPLPHVDAISDICVINCVNGGSGQGPVQGGGGQTGDILAKDYEADKAPNAFTTPMSASENFMVTATRDGYISVWK